MRRARWRSRAWKESNRRSGRCVSAVSASVRSRPRALEFREVRLSGKRAGGAGLPRGQRTISRNVAERRSIEPLGTGAPHPVVKRSLRRGISRRQSGTPVRMETLELHRGARLRVSLPDHPFDAARARTRFIMIYQRALIENGFYAAEAQPQPDVDVLPPVLRERFVETADGANRAQGHRNVRRPEVIAAVVRDAPYRRRQIVEAFHVDRTASHDRERVRLVRSQMLRDEIGKYEHVVVDKDDALAACGRDARVARLRQTGVGLNDDREIARRA